MSTKTEQELHVEREMALFEKGQKKFRCRGGQQQNLAAVLSRIDDAAAQARRAAAKKTQRVEVARATKGDAGDLANQAAAQTAAADQIGALASAVREIQKEVDATLGAGKAETQHVVAYLLNTGRKGEAADLDKHARDGCGQDLAKTIAALPRPCESAVYVCPKCGREGHASKTAEAVAEAQAE